MRSYDVAGFATCSTLTMCGVPGRKTACCGCTASAGVLPLVSHRMIPAARLRISPLVPARMLPTHRSEAGLASACSDPCL